MSPLTQAKSQNSCVPLTKHCRTVLQSMSLWLESICQRWFGFLTLYKRLWIAYLLLMARLIGSIVCNASLTLHLGMYIFRDRKAPRMCYEHKTNAQHTLWPELPVLLSFWSFISMLYTGGLYLHYYLHI